MIGSQFPEDKPRKSKLASLATGSASGCLVGVLVFFACLMCLCPLAAGIGGFTSTVTADFVAQIMEPYLCPEDSTAEIITFATTTTDEYGNETPATGYEMQCVDAEGSVVKDPGPEYAFYWVGLLMVASLFLSGLLAVVLAAPAGALIARYHANREN